MSQREDDQKTGAKVEPRPGKLFIAEQLRALRDRRGIEDCDLNEVIAEIESLEVGSTALAPAYERALRLLVRGLSEIESARINQLQPIGDDPASSTPASAPPLWPPPKPKA